DNRYAVIEEVGNIYCIGSCIDYYTTWAIANRRGSDHAAAQGINYRNAAITIVGDIGARASAIECHAIRLAAHRDTGYRFRCSSGIDNRKTVSLIAGDINAVAIGGYCNTDGTGANSNGIDHAVG